MSEVAEVRVRRAGADDADQLAVIEAAAGERFRTIPGLEFVADHDPRFDAAILDPRSTWADAAAYDRQAARLVSMFIDNFGKFEDHVDAAVLGAAPRVSEAAE